MADKETSKTESTEKLSLVEKIIQDGGMINDPSQSNYAKKMIGQFAGQILDEGMVFILIKVSSPWSMKELLKSIK